MTPRRQTSVAHEMFLDALDLTLEQSTNNVDAHRLGEMLREVYCLTADHPAVINWLNHWTADVLDAKDAA